MNDENLHNINCIIKELEQLKQTVIELETKINEREMNNDNEQRDRLLRKVPPVA